MKRLFLALFLLLTMRSEEAFTQSNPVDQIQTMMASQSCENLIQIADHIMKVNKIINQQDPAATVLVDRTMTVYLEIVQNQCKRIKKGGLSVTAR